MTVHIVMNDFVDRVVADFEHILTTDKGGFSVWENPPIDETMYNQTQHSFAKDRINAVVNSFSDHTVFVNGVESTYVYNGHLMSDVGGVTHVDPADRNPGQTGLNPRADVTIFYDTEACSGKGNYRFGPPDAANPAGVVIRGRTEISIFHELCHAFHWLNNDRNPAASEVQAETDENGLRAELGMPLRDPTNHGGGCCGDGSGNVCPGGCLIVTAVSGSDRSSEVEAFRLIRDRIVRRSILGDRFMAELLTEYHQFSHRVADDIRESLLLKSAVNALVVSPLLDFLFLLESHLRWGWQRPQLFRTTVQQTLERTLAIPACSALSRGQIDALASKLERLILPKTPEVGDSAGSSPWSGAPEELVDYFAERMGLNSAERPYLRWGLVRPLALYWRSVEQLMASSEVETADLGGYVAAVEDWLSFAPLPPITCELSEQTLRRELDSLAQSMLPIPNVRLRFEGRIAMARAASAGTANLTQAPGDQSNQDRDCGCHS